MARTKGLVPCSINFEVNKTAPLDSRTVIDSFAELTLAETWLDGGKVWLYDGLCVAVKDNKNVYMLVGQEADPTAYTKIENWHQVGKVLEVVDNLESTDATKALAASQGKVLAERIETLKTSLSSVYNYKGSVAKFSDLPEEHEVGDVYNVEQANGNIPAGTNYAWNGTAWDALGGSVDLSGYALKTDVETSISTAKDELTVTINGVDSKVTENTGKLATLTGDESTEGSLKWTQKQATDYTDAQLTAYVKKEDGKELITSEKLALIDTNATAISGLDTRVEATEGTLNVLQGDGEGSINKKVNDAIAVAFEWSEIK